MTTIEKIQKGINEPSDLSLGFDCLLHFIAANPESETAKMFVEFHEDEMDNPDSFCYLIGKDFKVKEWVAEEDWIAFEEQEGLSA